ncbi:MAG: hypothetical protein COA99_03655 [Moraxellaceae bacterium]|nr:MAG: hypothetical protein COA99_03655 [Moraxellaceae bacterium]
MDNATLSKSAFMHLISLLGSIGGRCSLLILIFMGQQNAIATPNLLAIDAFKAIMVDGSDLPNALNQPIKEFSLAAIADGDMEPIPYQIDEYNIGGAVFFEGWDVPRAGTEDIFDPADKLLFIYKDAGSRRESHHRFDGKIVHEIALTGDTGDVRYVYLVQNSRLRSEEQYIRYSAEEALVETDFFSVTYNKDNHMKWEDFTVFNYDGEENPFDALKIVLNTGILTNFVRVGLNNDDLVALPKGEVIGPIRSTTQLELTFWFLGLPYMSISVQIHHYPNSLIYDIRAMIPFFRRLALADPEILFGLEGNSLYGTEVRTAGGPKVPTLTDGYIDENEEVHIDGGISIKNNWVWATTKRNLDILGFLHFSTDRTQEISFNYNDDDKVIDLPERFPGQLPKVGYKIHALPTSGFFGFVVDLHFSNGFKGEPESFVPKAQRLPDISVFTPQ